MVQIYQPEPWRWEPLEEEDAEQRTEEKVGDLGPWGSVEKKRERGVALGAWDRGVGKDLWLGFFRAGQVLLSVWSG